MPYSALIPEQAAKKRAYDAARYAVVRGKKVQQAKDYYAENKAKVLARQKAKYDADPKAALIAQRAYMAKNPEKYREIARLASENSRKRNPELARERTKLSQRKRREESPEEVREYQQARYWADPEKHRARAIADGHTRRARKLEVGGTFTAEDVDALMKKQKGNCAFCLKPFGDRKPHVDHYIPLARGGSNDRKNLRLLHRKCNLKKHAKHPADFGLEHGLLAW